MDATGALNSGTGSCYRRTSAPSRPELAAQEAQVVKAAREAAEKKEQADKKALRAQIEQLIEQIRLPQAQTDGRYNIVDGNKINKIRRMPPPITHRGETAIVRRKRRL